MKIAYFDCFSGISGDMCLGALLDAGASLAALKRGLAALPLKGFAVRSRRVRRAGIRAVKADVELAGRESPPRRLGDVKAIIDGSGLPAGIRKKATGIFGLMFGAEARVHGGRPEAVHLHELGAVDAIVDVLGTLICLDDLGVKKVYASAVNVGGGTVMAAHGRLPVPAPAAAVLLEGVPVYSGGQDMELATPTGAAMLRGLCEGFGPVPEMTLTRVGMGAGSADPKGGPNVLRVLLGEGAGASAEPPGEVLVLETNIDDMDPRIYGYVMERLLKEGALDVFLTQVIMKKGRPGVKLTVICREDGRPAVEDVIFRETTTLGVRYARASRTVLERETRTLDTPYGPIRVKEGRAKGGPAGSRALKAMPEYEDCRRAAIRHGAPLADIIREAGRGRKARAPRPRKGD